MAIQDITPIQSFTANGITQEFVFNFSVKDKEDISVSVNGTLSNLNDYWCNQETNTIRFYTTPIEGTLITIKRETSLIRRINYETFNGTFRPETLNYDFDRLWQKLQELFCESALTNAYATNETVERVEGDKLVKAHVEQVYANWKTWVLAEFPTIAENMFNNIFQDFKQQWTEALNALTIGELRTEAIIDSNGLNQKQINDEFRSLLAQTLSKEDNLASVTNKVTARSNLNVYSKSEVDTAITNATPTIPDATQAHGGIVRLSDSSDISNNSETTVVTPKDVNAMLVGLGVPTSAPRAFLAFGAKPKVGTNSSVGSVITATIINHGLSVGDVINITYSVKTVFSSSTKTDTVTVSSVTNENNFVFNGSGGSGSGSGYACTLNFVIKANTNISAITDLGVGYFRITMTTALASNNYLVFAQAYDSTNALRLANLDGLFTKTTTQFEIKITDISSNLTDPDFIHIGVFL